MRLWPLTAGMVAVCLLASACVSASSDPDTAAAQPDGPGPEATATPDPTTPDRPSDDPSTPDDDLTPATGTFDITPGQATVIETGQLRLDVASGTAANDGTVTVAEVDDPQPDITMSEVTGFVAAQDVVSVELDAELDAPVTVTFDPDGRPDDVGDEVPADAVPAIMRHDVELGWYPIAAAPPGETVTHERVFFSPMVPGWLVNFSDSVQHFLGKRHDSPSCSGSPDWFTAEAAPQDLVLTCGTTTGEGDQQRGEIQLVNNRGIVLEVTIPDEAAYAWVDGQPEPVRQLVRDYLGRDGVLLAPGQRMSVGFDQPDDSALLSIPVAPSSSALLFSLLLQLVGDVDPTGVVAIAAVLGDCGVPAATNLNVDIDTATDLVKVAIECIVSLLGDTDRAIAVLSRAVAAVNDVPLDAVIGDRRFAAQLDQFQGMIHVLGAISRGHTVVSLGSDINDLAADLYEYADGGVINSFSPTVALRRREPPEPLSGASARGTPLELDEFLEEFARAWASGDQDEIDRYLAPDPTGPVEAYTPDPVFDPATTTVEVIFDNSCLGGSSGGGACLLQVHDGGPTGAELWWVAYYEDYAGDVNDYSWWVDSVYWYGWSDDH